MLLTGTSTGIVNSGMFCILRYKFRLCATFFIPSLFKSMSVSMLRKFVFSQPLSLKSLAYSWKRVKKSKKKYYRLCINLCGRNVYITIIFKLTKMSLFSNRHYFFYLLKNHSYISSIYFFHYICNEYFSLCISLCRLLTYTVSLTYIYPLHTFMSLGSQSSTAVGSSSSYNSSSSSLQDSSSTSTSDVMHLSALLILI